MVTDWRQTPWEIPGLAWFYPKFVKWYNSSAGSASSRIGTCTSLSIIITGLIFTDITNVISLTFFQHFSRSLLLTNILAFSEDFHFAFSLLCSEFSYCQTDTTGGQLCISIGWYTTTGIILLSMHACRERELQLFPLPSHHHYHTSTQAGSAVQLRVIWSRNSSIGVNLLRCYSYKYQAEQLQTMKYFHCYK